MVQDYEYIKLIGLVAFLAGILKLVIGFLGHSFGAHSLSSFIILGIGVVVYFIGLIIQKLSEIKEE